MRRTHFRPGRNQITRWYFARKLTGRGGYESDLDYWQHPCVNRLPDYAPRASDNRKTYDRCPVCGTIHGSADLLSES